MAKKSGGKGNIMGAVGGILIGAAILLFVVTIVLNSLKTATVGQPTADRTALNATIDQLKTFLTVIVILLAILGIVIIGATIISSIGGAFGT